MSPLILVLVGLGACRGPLDNETKVNLELRMQAQEVPVWGRLPMTLVLTNSGETPVPYGAPLLCGNDYGTARLVITVEEVATGNKRDFPGRNVAMVFEGVGRNADKLEAGGTRESEVCVAGTASLDPAEDGTVRRSFVPAFAKPGQYVITAIYTLAGQRWTSERATIAVVDAPESATAALDYLKTMEHPMWVYYPKRMPTTVDPEGIPAADIGVLATRYPPNVYSDYARLALSSRCLQLATMRTEVDAIVRTRKEHLEFAKSYADGLEGRFGTADRAAELLVLIDGARRKL